MKKIKLLLLMLAMLVLAPATPASAQSKFVVPVTGRKVKLWVSDEQVLSLSSQEYQNYLKTAQISTDATNTALVKKVGQKMATAVETYLKENNRLDAIQNYNWEFNLVKDNSANAFCMPGGKIVVYEGLLPVTQSEAALAIVLGHEIAHAVAKHSAEQMSTQMKQQLGAKVLSGILGATGAGTTTSILSQTAFSLGSKLGSLKYSRDNESEADYMGLIFAAMAGYDPNVAVDFWQRMASTSSNTKLAFLSDHPSDAKRIANIKKWLPEALKYYKPVTTTTSSTTSKASSKKTTTKKTTTKKSTTKKTSTKKTTKKTTSKKK